MVQRGIGALHFQVNGPGSGIAHQHGGQAEHGDKPQHISPCRFIQHERCGAEHGKYNRQTGEAVRRHPFVRQEKQQAAHSGARQGDENGMNGGGGGYGGNGYGNANTNSANGGGVSGGGGGGYGGNATGSGGGGYGIGNYGKGGDGNTGGQNGADGICVITWIAQES